tara:strand:+ start:289 stop:408 length:120 start_codon:yes stop_codon:yes gene_type:complete
MTENEKPPVFKSWKGWYFLLLVVLFIIVVLLYWMTLVFS